jgi:virginiamycin B lyase
VYTPDPAGYIDAIRVGGSIGRIKVGTAFGFPFGIARFPDGSLWVSELTGFYEFSRHLLRFPAGSAKPSLTVTLPDRLSDVIALTAGPGGTVWFADFGTGQVGEVHQDGQVSVYDLTDPFGGLSDIAAGPGGSMWFTEQDGIIGRVSPGGKVREMALPLGDGNPNGIAAGPGNSIWVTETGSDAVVEITLR